MDSSVGITKLAEPAPPQSQPQQPPPPPASQAPPPSQQQPVTTTTSATTPTTLPHPQQQHNRPSTNHHSAQTQRPPLQNQHAQPQHPFVNSNSNSTSGAIATSNNNNNNNERFPETTYIPNKQCVVSSVTATSTATPSTASPANNLHVPPTHQPVVSTNVVASTTTSATVINRPATIITTNATRPNAITTSTTATISTNTNQQATPTAGHVISKGTNKQLPNNQNPIVGLTIEDVDLFFEDGRYNSCQAVEELIKSIEKSHNESLAWRVLNLYQRYYTTLERPWDHETFMYGLGLIYMHFSAYDWAVKSFRDTVYVQPGFQRSRDVHTRLGLIYKARGRYKLSEKHFNLAIQDLREDSGTSTGIELRFHLAHLSEIQGKTQQAIEAYERLLQEKDLPPKLSSNIHRQLGWIHYSTATKSSSSSISGATQHHNESSGRRKNQEQNPSSADHQKLDTALNYLNTAYQIDSDSQTSYYLGRCLTNVGKVRDAFAYYRSVKDKEETNADTWCSMGVLYQRQNQPLDALQAYIRSVQYDKRHSVAWMNLGILYENHNYFRDALKCYQHVLRSSPDGGIGRLLRERISYIRVHLKDIEAAAAASTSGNNNGKSDNNSDKLLSLEDLWNMESKTNQESCSPSITNNNNTNSNSNKHDDSMRQATAPPIKPAQPNASDALHDPNRTDDRAHDTIKLTTPSDTSRDNQISTNDSRRPMIASSGLPCNGMSVNEINHIGEGGAETITHNKNLEDIKPLMIEADSKSTDVAPPSSLADQTERDATSSALNGLPQQATDQKSAAASQVSLDSKPQSLDAKQLCINQLYTNGASKDSGISSDSSTYTDYALVPSQSLDSSTASYISAEQIIRSCRDASSRPKKLDINLISDDTKPPSANPRPPAYPPLPSDKLFPLAPSIFVDSKKELTSKKLFDTCRSNPISIMRNMANVLKLDLGLFSTKTLVESNPEQRVDITSHLYYPNSDGHNEETPTTSTSDGNPWICARQRSSSTISTYASYQVASFKQSLLEERDSKAKPSMLAKESETDSNESGLVRKNHADGSGTSKQQAACEQQRSGPGNKKFKRDTSEAIKMVKSANMIDISCEQTWRPQLTELNKLPYFLRCVSASNMLTHIGSAVPGLNTNTLSMQVPGCRFVGNRKSNQMCFLSLNIGPGEFEWHAIPGDYEHMLQKLCGKHGFDYHEDDWWPRLNDIQKCNIPVYRFSQRPGDLVWVNSSTIFWVQSAGWTNCIQWNMGPLCGEQFRLTSESCELDKLHSRKSDVPVVQMTWNLVMNISLIQDDDLFQQMVSVMRRSLRYCRLIMDLCDELQRDIDISDEIPGPRSAKFCSLCECEVFNITFRLKNDQVIHCIECAQRSDAKEKLSKEYKIDQVYDLSYLMQLYDNFIETRRKYQIRQSQLAQQQQQQQAQKQ